MRSMRGLCVSRAILNHRDRLASEGPASGRALAGFERRTVPKDRAYLLGEAGFLAVLVFFAAGAFEAAAAALRGASVLLALLVAALVTGVSVTTISTRRLRSFDP